MKFWNSNCFDLFVSKIDFTGVKIEEKMCLVEKQLVGNRIFNLLFIQSIWFFGIAKIAEGNFFGFKYQWIAMFRYISFLFYFLTKEPTGMLFPCLESVVIWMGKKWSKVTISPKNYRMFISIWWTNSCMWHRCFPIQSEYFSCSTRVNVQIHDFLLCLFL